MKHRELVIQLQHPMTTLMPRGVHWHAYKIQAAHIFVGLIQAFATLLYIYTQTLALLAQNKWTDPWLFINVGTTVWSVSDCTVCCHLPLCLCCYLSGHNAFHDFTWLSHNMCSDGKKLVWGLMFNMQIMRSLFSLLWFVVRLQASSRRCEGGGRVEEVLRAEEASWRAGLHSQEPIQTSGGVSTFSPCTSFW